MEIYVGTYQGSIIVLQTDTAKIKPIKHMQISQNSIKSICAINSTYLIAGGFDQQLRVMDLHTYQQKVEAKQNIGQITKITQVNDRLFAIGVDEGSIRLWNSNTWSMTTQARFHKKSISSIVVSKQGKLMITAGGNKIILWSAQNLKKAHQYKFEKDLFIQHLRLSQDMKYIFYSTSKNELRKISTENNEQSVVLKLPTPRKIQDFLLYESFVILANDIGEIIACSLQNISTKQEQLLADMDKKIWFKAHDARIKEIKIVNEQYLLIVTAAGDVSLWDFPQFLKSVQHVSQTYSLDGLTSLCSIQIKGRILCVDYVIKHVNQEQKRENSQQQIQQKLQLEQKQNQTNKKQRETPKNKTIKKKQKKQEKHKIKTNNNQERQKIQKKKIKNKKKMNKK